MKSLNIENLLISMNYPLFANVADSTHEIILEHITGSKPTELLDGLPSVADAITNDDLVYLKGRYELTHGFNSEGHRDSWLINKKTGRRNKANKRGYRRMNLNGRKVMEHRAIMAMWADCPLPGWVVVNHAVNCTIWNDGKSNDVFNLRMTTSRGNSLDQKVRDGAPNLFTGYKWKADRQKWDVRPTLLDSSQPSVLLTPSETTAYLVRCLLLLWSFGDFWWHIKGEHGLVPRVDPMHSHKLIMPGHFGFDRALPLSEALSDDGFFDEMVINPIADSDSAFLFEHGDDLIELRESLVDSYRIMTTGLPIQQDYARKHEAALRTAQSARHVRPLVKALGALFEAEWSTYDESSEEVCHAAA
ncbi:hypothetical protein [Kluyvera georgiana]|uniref:hypothetical protein n=1 Tax=Kluyvera georgiana TaxID=73098 RepID=UPI0008070D34|nr:hypothetical protein [Kluyvera georgiana]